MTNSGKKTMKEIPAKKFYFFGGIFYCLLSISLIINYGFPTKVITYGPNFLFGVGAFLLYVILYIIGVYYIFKEKPLKLRINQYLFGSIIIFVALLVGLTMGYNYKANDTYKINGDSFISFFNSLNGGKGYLSSQEANNLFTQQAGENMKFFGGGYLGSLLVDFLFANLKTSNNVWLITIITGSIGVLVFFGKQIYDLLRKYIFKNIKPVTHKKKEKPVKNKKQSNNEELDDYSSREFTPLFSSKEETKVVEQPSNNIEEPIKQESQLNLGSSMEQYMGSGTFTQARFVRFNEKKSADQVRDNNSINFEQPQQNQNAFSKPVFNGFTEPSFIAKNEPIIQEEKIETPLPIEEHLEQGNIFEESKPVINESMVTAQVQYEERKVINQSQTISAVPEKVEPVVAKKDVIRKPVKWIPPSADLLEEYETSEAIKMNEEVANERLLAIDQLFTDFNIGAHVEDFTIGPSVTRFNIRCNKDVSVQTIAKKVDDISIRLNGLGCRFTPIVEGQSTSGLEVPNAKVTTVSFKEVFTKLPPVKDCPLSVPFGKNIKGEVIAADFGQFPHLLVAGTTGSGKSIYVHSIIASLIMRNSPDDLKLFIVDPKGNEMAVYRDIPHLLCPIVNEAHKAKMVLSKLCDEMNDRYRCFETAEFASDLKEYNKYAREHDMPTKPYIVCIIDEYADLVENCKEISSPVVQIGQKARAAGIHLLIATQRPSTNVVTGTIKANLPTHVALTTGSPIDSITIIGEGGAEKLLGKGDMLVQCFLFKNGAARLQGCFVSKKELSRVSNYLKEHYETVYDEKYLNLDENAQNSGKAMAMAGQIQQGSTDDADEAKYQSIKEWVMSMQYVSMSRIQGECGVGFNRARRIFSRLQQEGVVGYDNVANKGCPVLIRDGGCEVDTDSIPVSSQTSHIG